MPQEIERKVLLSDGLLKKLGVDVRTGTKALGADKHGVSIERGQRIDAPLGVWAAESVVFGNRSVVQRIAGRTTIRRI